LIRNYLAIGILAGFSFLSCSNKNPRPAFRDGYYAAEMRDFDSHGWKEYISIQINNGYIVTVEYNARNVSGFIKSWNPDYMRTMNASDGTYPNKYTRMYATALLILQNANLIEAISGATESYANFVQLANAAIKQAREGSKQVALVDIPAKEP
jgi:major membrane immunogen (membrane-anchored lipoprotein)